MSRQLSAKTAVKEVTDLLADAGVTGMRVFGMRIGGAMTTTIAGGDPEFRERIGEALSAGIGALFTDVIVRPSLCVSVIHDESAEAMRRRERAYVSGHRIYGPFASARAARDWLCRQSIVGSVVVDEHDARRSAATLGKAISAPYA